MKYSGRIACILFAFLTKVFWQFHYHINQSWDINDFFYNIPVMVIAWYMGKKYDELRFIADYDPLTKVKNRRYINDSFPKIFKRWKRSQKNVCVFLIDIDNFKYTNDNNGHRTGDILLEEVSIAIRKVTRKTDIVARWGGDEFLIITPFLSEENAQQLIKRIKESIKEQENFKKYGESVSIGFSYYPKHGKELNELIHQADLFMYQDKQNYKTKSLK